MSFSLTDVDTATRPRPISGKPTVDIVVPCFNEEEALGPLLECVVEISEDLLRSGSIARPLDLILVDDGSSDRTWDAICHASKTLPVTGIRLSRNQGHQHALLAGLMHAEADVVISMDADLQDDPRAIVEMIDAYNAGAEIVFGVRRSRSVDTWFKRNSASAYYGLLRRFGVDIVPNHADFRLMSRKAIHALEQFEETNLFLRGIVCQIGLRTDTVVYDRAARTAGKSSYPLGRMLALALDGITSFSVRPLRMITWMGFSIAAVSFALIIFSLGAWMIGGTIPGWTSIIIPIYLLGGAHLFALGVIGEYVGKIYQESKRRPRFLIDEIISPNAESNPKADEAANE